MSFAGGKGFVQPTPGFGSKNAKGNIVTDRNVMWIYGPEERGIMRSVLYPVSTEPYLVTSVNMELMLVKGNYVA